MDHTSPGNDDVEAGSNVPPRHDEDETTLSESYRQDQRSSDSTDPAKKFGTWRDNRDGDGMRFPEEADMRPDGNSPPRPKGADATAGSEERPISSPESPGHPGASD